MSTPTLIDDFEHLLDKSINPLAVTTLSLAPLHPQRYRCLISRAFRRGPIYILYLLLILRLESLRGNRSDAFYREPPPVLKEATYIYTRLEHGAITAAISFSLGAGSEGADAAAQASRRWGREWNAAGREKREQSRRAQIAGESEGSAPAGGVGT